MPSTYPLPEKGSYPNYLRFITFAAALLLLLLSSQSLRAQSTPVGTPLRLIASRTTSPLAPAGLFFRGNKKSMTFHKPGCRHFNSINCTETFTSRQAALRAGYKPCYRCRP
jgi:hypothetical protein